MVKGYSLDILNFSPVLPKLTKTFLFVGVSFS